MPKFLESFALALFLFSLPGIAQEKVFPESSDTLLKQGRSLYDSGRYKNAIAIFRQVDRNDTNYVRALYGISLCYLGDSLFNEAIVYAKKALARDRDRDPDPELDPELYNHYGNSLIAIGDLPGAFRLFDSAIKKYPAYSLLYLNKGTVLLQQKKFAEAEAIFQQVLLMDPYSYSSHFKLGYCALNQGKLVPALLSFVGYLLLTPEGRYHSNCINFLKAIANNTDDIQAFVNQRKEQPDENYQLTEQILQSKIALDKNYKPLTQLDDPIPRQIQAVFEKIEYQETDNDFWMQYYIPFFKSVFTSNRFESFITRLFTSVNLPVIQDYLKKNKKEIAALVDSTATYLDLIRSTRMLSYLKRDTVSMQYYFSHGHLSSYGKYLKKEDKLIGPWIFYYGPGNVRSTGMYDKEGKKEGPWVYYHFNGQVKGNEIYVNGKQEGEETYYFSNGVKSSHSFYKNGQLEGESISFKWVGIPETITHYHEGKADGNKIVFYNNGDTSEIQTYRNGVLNGELRSYTKYRTKDVTVSYSDGKWDGMYKKYYPDGQIKEEGRYESGELEGETKSYFPDGRLQAVRNLVHSKVEGEYKEYHENGALSTTYFAKAGNVDGDIRHFDDDGKLYSIFHYSNSLLQKAQFFDKDGKLLNESVRGPKGIELLEFLPDGSKRMKAVYDEKDNITGMQTFYYPSGKILETDEYRDGRENGPSIAYYTNGNIKAETGYADGKVDGYRQALYSHGQVQEEGWNRSGTAQGYWIYHNPMGAVTDSIYYLDGVLEGYKPTYNPNGRIAEETRYIKGWLTEWIQYDTMGKELSHHYLPAGTGKVQLIYPNGQPFLSAEFRSAQKVGPYIVRYPNGKIGEVSHYTRGMQDSGFRSYYVSGTVQTEGQYQYGEKTGTWKRYYSNGMLKTTEQYIHDQLDSQQVNYDEAGKIAETLPYKDGKLEGIRKRYDPDGTLLCQVTYKNDIPIAYTYLDRRDSLLPEILIKRQAGKIKTFFPNGNVSAEFEYLDGKYAGDIRLYYTNGKLKSVAHFDNGTMEGNYNTYYPNGQQHLSMPYVHDNMHGVFKVYNEKGTLTEEWNYYCGLPQGPARLFDDAGRLLETEVYYYGTLVSIQK